MSDASPTAPVIGVDLGGTKILVGVVSGEHTILARSKRSTPAKDGGDAILATILEAIHEALGEAKLNLEDIGAVGIGSPGPLDPKTGIIPFSANLNVRDWPLAPSLSEKTGRPVLLQNDVRVGGYGEFRLGAGRGHKNVLAAFVGTGIGGCVILDGKIVEGSTGNAGEVGHIILKPNGPRCGCGQNGCMEAFASRTAITRRITKAVRKGKVTVLAGKIQKGSGRLKSGDIAAAVAAADPVALKEVNRAAHYLGLGLGGLVNVLGPELVIIGGGVTQALGPAFVDLIRRSAREQILADPEHTIRIEPAELGDDAGILGASLLAREKFLAE
jgi:glucokinase